VVEGFRVNNGAIVTVVRSNKVPIRAEGLWATDGQCLGLDARCRPFSLPFQFLLDTSFSAGTGLCTVGRCCHAHCDGRFQRGNSTVPSSGILGMNFRGRCDLCAFNNPGEEAWERGNVLAVSVSCQFSLAGTTCHVSSARR
jgi:hypothetical protein